LKALETRRVDIEITCLQGILQNSKIGRVVWKRKEVINCQIKEFYKEYGIILKIFLADNFYLYITSLYKWFAGCFTTNIKKGYRWVYKKKLF